MNAPASPVPTGYVKLHRKAFDPDHGDAFWLEPREFSRWEAWVDVIQLAAFRTHNVRTAHGTFELQRGEFVASLRWLARRWKWSVKRVRAWLTVVQKGARVRAQRETQDGTVYLIVNYETYQSRGHSKGHTEGHTEGHSEGTPRAQQGHKTEAGRSKKKQTPNTLSESTDEVTVGKHYLAAHPTYRVVDYRPIRKALALGYSPADLCEAIDGNAADEWHRRNGKHDLPYVLRAANIGGFRAKAQAGNEPMVDPATGLFTEAGLAVARGER